MLYLNKNLILESTSSLEEAEVALMGAPFDSTSSYRAGSRAAPLEIRREFLELEKEESFFAIPFHDLGNVEVVPGNAQETLARVQETVKWVYERNPGVFLITLGGEHTITHAIAKNINRSFELVSLDAHMDLKDSYLGERWCHATVMRRIAEEGIRLTEVGVRSFLEEEEKYARERGVAYCGKERNVVEAALKALEGKSVYVSLDYDAISPEIASGVSNPEPNGLSLDDIDFIFNKLIQKSTVVGMDVVEVNPLYDKTSTTVAAAKLVRDVTAKVASSKKRG